MQRSLAFIALGAIVAVGALCAAAASAYGVEPRDGAVATTRSVALVVPSGYKPSTFAPSPVRSAAAGLVSVAPHPAVAVTSVTSTSPAGEVPTPGPKAKPTPGPKAKPGPDTKPDSTKPAPTPPPAPITSTPPAPAKPSPPAKGSDKGKDVNNKGTGSNEGPGGPGKD